jgi:enterochelin esterase family protein
MDMTMMKTCAVIAAVLCASQQALAQQAHVNLDWNPHKNVQNLNPYGANVISPEVRDDRTVTFRV